LIAGVLLAVVGVYLAIRTVAALHRIRDLWYAIDREWPRVARAAVGWSGGSAIVAMLAPASARAAFVAGFSLYVVFYVTTALVLSRVVVARAAARIGEAPRQPD